MTPAERVAAAIAAGEMSVREGESLLGFVQLLPQMGDSGSWPRSTYYARFAQLERLGLSSAIPL